MSRYYNIARRTFYKIQGITTYSPQGEKGFTMKETKVNIPCDKIPFALDKKITKYIATIYPIPRGERNNCLHFVGHRLRKKFGLTGDALKTKLSGINQTKCTPPLEEGEVTTIVRSIDKANDKETTKRSTDKTSKSKPKQQNKYSVSANTEPLDTVKILGKEVSVYSHCRKNTPVCTLTIGAILETFRTGGKSKELIETVRSETDKDKRGELKQELHAIVFSSEPQAERKADACTQNGILCLDFDGILQAEIEEAKEKIMAVPYVFCVGLSVSGTGVFALVHYEKPADLKTLLSAMQADFSYELDKSCSDVSRLRFVTLDKNLIVKEKVYPAILHERTELVSVESALPRSSGEVPEKIGIDVLDSFWQQIEEISFSEFESDGGKVGHNGYYIGSIGHLLRTARLNQWDIGMKNGASYFFTSKFWQRIDIDTFQHFLQIVGMRQGIPHKVIKDHLFVKKLVDQFASEARVPVLSTNDTPKINLRNGTLHILSDRTEIKPFDKRDGLTYQLHYDYDPSATAPLFKQFLDRVLPNVAVQKLVFQYIGYVFLRNMRLEKVLFLYGGGANGKSVLLNIIRALIGIEQCCEFSLEGITKHESQRAQLGHYLFNVSTEISTRMSTDIFKKIASREPLQAKYLYKDPFTLRDYATSVFAMNELPRDVEQTAAFFRRFIIIPFDVRIPSEEQDPDLAKKIIDSEMSGVLNYVIDGMKSLISERQFDIPDVVRGVVEKFRQESDSVLSFLDEDGYRISAEIWKPLKNMHDAYKERCKADLRQAVSKTTFSQRLRNLGYTVEKRGHLKQTMVNAENTEDREAKDREDRRKLKNRDDEVPY